MSRIASVYPACRRPSRVTCSWRPLLVRIPGRAASSRGVVATSSVLSSRFRVGPGVNCLYHRFNNGGDGILSQVVSPSTLSRAEVGNITGTFSLASGSWHYFTISIDSIDLSYTSRVCTSLCVVASCCACVIRIGAPLCIVLRR